tara:strand:- start:4779 stop:5084 length:306 start_codon:yes stop_codon:yes gene_type:complete
MPKLPKFEFSPPTATVIFMDLLLTPDLDEFVSEQARRHGFSTGSDFVVQLIANHKERESHGWDWLYEQLRPGIEADESQFHPETAEDVIRRGKARMSSGNG